MDKLIDKKILPSVDNKLIKANFKDLVTFRIKINLFRCLRTRIIQLKWFLKCFNRFLKHGIRYIFLLKFTLTAFIYLLSFVGMLS